MKGVVFLDRDGVINTYPGKGKYVCSVEEFKFIKGAISSLKKLKDEGFVVFVISNQSGVGKGVFSTEDLDRITSYMQQQLRRRRVVLDGVFYCLHHPDENCKCRKPRTYLLKKALQSKNIKKTPHLKMFFVGDSLRDILTGKRFGCKTILVLSGEEKIDNRDKWSVHPHFVAKNLKEAVNIILS